MVFTTAILSIRQCLVTDDVNNNVKVSTRNETQVAQTLEYEQGYKASPVIVLFSLIDKACVCVFVEYIASFYNAKTANNTEIIEESESA